jgi:hypothetical protein
MTMDKHLEMIVVEEKEWKKAFEEEKTKDLGKLYCPDLKCKEDYSGYKVLEAGEEAGVVYKD